MKMHPALELPIEFESVRRETTILYAGPADLDGLDDIRLATEADLIAAGYVKTPPGYVKTPPPAPTPQLHPCGCPTCALELRLTRKALTAAQQCIAQITMSSDLPSPVLGALESYYNRISGREINHCGDCFYLDKRCDKFECSYDRAFEVETAGGRAVRPKACRDKKWLVAP